MTLPLLSNVCSSSPGYSGQESSWLNHVGFPSLVSNQRKPSEILCTAWADSQPGSNLTGSRSAQQPRCHCCTGIRLPWPHPKQMVKGSSLRHMILAFARSTFQSAPLRMRLLTRPNTELALQDARPWRVWDTLIQCHQFWLVSSDLLLHLHHLWCPSSGAYRASSQWQKQDSHR